MENSFQKNRSQPEKAPLTRVFGSLAFLFLFMVLTTGCAQQPMPEADSPPAILYVVKCGICHTPFHPEAHTFIGWKKVVTRMEQNARAQGMEQLLSEDERTSILAYLEKTGRKGF